MAHTRWLSTTDVGQLRRFHFLDEAGVHLGMTRLYARAEPGERVVEGTPGYSGAHYTVTPSWLRWAYPVWVRRWCLRVR